MRNLIYTGSAFVEGEDVKAVQRALKKFKDLSRLKVDGEYGPGTASAIAYWKRFIAGYPDAMMPDNTINSLGRKGQRMLLGQQKIPATWRVRARNRRNKMLKQKAETMTVGQRMLVAGMKYKGLTEDPSGSNYVPALSARAKELGVIPWIANMRYFWCAFFVMLCGVEANSTTARDAIISGKFNGLYTPEILSRAMKGINGMRVVGWSEIREGTVLMINFPGGDPRVDHTGLARRQPNGDQVPTLEGNTSSDNVGSQSNGGGVFERVRDRSQISAAIDFA